jgi:ribulose-5-phosphate 4-epimerase/fuculose-1-phosphate aldolase
LTPETDPYEAFAAAARRAGALRLMQCSSGNISCRIDAGRMLVKASRAWMADLTPQQVSLCSIADGARLDGPAPSVEIGFHAGILRSRSDVNVVLHFQTPAATTLACAHPESVNFFVIPEIPVYIGPIGIVPFLDPGSRPLADAVTQVMKTHNLAILKNHGMVTVGKSYDDAIQKAVFFELACDIILRGGRRIEPLPADAAAQFCRGAVAAA